MYQKLLIAIDPEDDGEAKFALATAISMLPKGGELHLASIYSPGDSGFSRTLPPSPRSRRRPRLRSHLICLCTNNYLLIIT